MLISWNTWWGYACSNQNHGLKMHVDCCWDPNKPTRFRGRCVYSYDLGVFCMPKFWAYENLKKLKKKMSPWIFLDMLIVNMLYSSFVYQSKICPVLGFRWDMCKSVTSHCRSVGFCIVLCVVSTLNSLAIQSKACISTAKYKHSPFLWKLCWNCFLIIFSENTKKQKRTENTLNALNFSRNTTMLLFYVYFTCISV